MIALQISITRKCANSFLDPGIPDAVASILLYKILKAKTAKSCLLYDWSVALFIISPVILAFLFFFSFEQSFGGNLL